MSGKAKEGEEVLDPGEGEVLVLRLYVAGQTPKSLAALSNLRKICEQHLDSKYEIEVVDLMEDPGRAAADQVVAIPTLIRKLPVPVRRIIGDLSNVEHVLVALEVESRQRSS